MDKLEFKTIISPLFEVFRVEPTKSMLLSYYDVLSTYPCEVLAVSVKEMIATKQFMPKPVEIREVIARLTYVNIFDAIDSDNEALLDHSIKRLK